MPRGGKRDPGPGKRNGRPAKPKLPGITSTNQAIEILDALARSANETDSPIVQKFRSFSEGPDFRIQWESWWKVYEKAHGKAVHTVNHLHDKPIEMNVTVTLSEAIQKARKRAGLKA